MLVCLGGAGVYALLARGAGRPASAIGGARGAIASASAVSGPVWYTRTVRSMHESLPAGGITLTRRGFTRRHGPEVRFDLRVSEETWVGVDGTIRDRTVAAAVRFRSAADRTRWRAYGRPVPNFNSVWLGLDQPRRNRRRGRQVPATARIPSRRVAWPLRQRRRGQPVYLSAAARAAERAGGAARPAQAGGDSARSAPGVARRPERARTPAAGASSSSRISAACSPHRSRHRCDARWSTLRSRCPAQLSTGTHTTRSGVPASP